MSQLISHVFCRLRVSGRGGGVSCVGARRRRSVCRGEAEAFRVMGWWGLSEAFRVADKVGRCEAVAELCEEVHGTQPRPRQGEEAL